MSEPSLAPARRATSDPMSRDRRQALRLVWQIAKVRAAEARLRCEQARLRQLVARVHD